MAIYSPRFKSFLKNRWSSSNILYYNGQTSQIGRKMDSGTFRCVLYGVANINVPIFLMIKSLEIERHFILILVLHKIKMKILSLRLHKSGALPSILSRESLKSCTMMMMFPYGMKYMTKFFFFLSILRVFEVWVENLVILGIIICNAGVNSFFFSDLNKSCDGWMDGILEFFLHFWFSLVWALDFLFEITSLRF